MTEPAPVYHTLPPVDLEALERQLTAALVAIWKAQGKRKKIVTLTPVDTQPAIVVLLQQNQI
ncbi:MAG: hypothetical protein E6Q97_02985 [Desulfurellales bacterium]|nr:MAG: hypothetical protein E6Q97_02985 [Desulfurellales bacterium]